MRTCSCELKVIEDSISQPSLAIPEWIDMNASQKIARIRALPSVDSIPFEIDLQSVVEYYSKRM